MIEFNDEVARRLETMYMAPPVVERRREFLELLAVRPGEDVLDVGCGPGFFTAELAEAVGATGRVCGLDRSETMLSVARARCGDHAEFVHGEATRLPLADGAFDVVTVTQVYEYVADLEAALGELRRVLRAGGRALVVDTDWDSIVWHASDPARMRRILAAWDEHLADPYLPRTLGVRLERAGFAVTHREARVTLETACGKNTLGGGLIDLVCDFVPDRRGVTAEETEAWSEDLHQLAEAGAYFFSLNRYLFLAQKPR
jgi:ubiquinone/menaquinone biosynthesis C-methylase UbiE